MQYKLKGTKKRVPSACNAHPQPHYTPLTCTTNTLYRVIMNEDQCLCFNQGATLRLMKDTAYFCRPGTNKYHLKKLLPLHSNISDWSITGRSICVSHCHVAFHGSGRSINVNGILIFIPRLKLITQMAGGYFLGERKKVVFQGCSE